jgi:class 3 adenylate cyclase
MALTPMRTETLAIVFTDIKGYTAATSAQTHAQNARMLKSMASLVTPVVRAFDGRIVKTIGDAYMIVFRSPTDAMRCALAVQDGLHQNNQGKKEDEGIHIRIAMNIGEVRVHRGDVFGDPVNIASRIESVTPADEVYLSEAMYLTMNRSDLAIERVGEYELKGIPEPVTVYRARRFADLPDDPKAREAAMPFGGKQIAAWQRNRWLQRATIGVWAFAIIGLLWAGYIRYRPEADYGRLVQETKNAIDQNEPLEAIAKAGQIPSDAVQERTLARRYRRLAAQQLFERSEVDTAKAEIDALLGEDPRDADALMLRGLIAAKKDDLKTAFAALSEALRLNPGLAQRSDLTAVAARGYSDVNNRRAADTFVEVYLKDQAVPALTRLMQTSQNRDVRVAAAIRLEKLGAKDEVDWVSLALEDLKSTSCKTKRNAIQKLVTEGDERAVGPLMKLGESKSCVQAIAKKAAEQIMGK